MNRYTKQIEIVVPFIKNQTSDCVYLKDVNIKYENKIVKLLSQKELAQGWRQVLPTPRMKVRFTERNNYTTKRKVIQYIVQKVNLSQLPEYLWNKLELNNSNENYKYKPIIDKVVKYNIGETPVDNEIIELKSILNDNNSARIIELLQILDDNNINGWIIIRAKAHLGDNIQVL
jgi:hypothetical protein